MQITPGTQSAHITELLCSKSQAQISTGVISDEPRPPLLSVHQSPSTPASTPMVTALPRSQAGALIHRPSRTQITANLQLCIITAGFLLLPSAIADSLSAAFFHRRSNPHRRALQIPNSGVVFPCRASSVRAPVHRCCSRRRPSALSPSTAFAASSVPPHTSCLASPASLPLSAVRVPSISSLSCSARNREEEELKCNADMRRSTDQPIGSTVEKSTKQVKTQVNMG